jgi:hypothetical protein
MELLTLEVLIDWPAIHDPSKYNQNKAYLFDCAAFLSIPVRGCLMETFSSPSITIIA